MISAQEERDVTYWIWLSKLSKVTLKEKHKLLDRFINPKAIFLAGIDGVQSNLCGQNLCNADFSLEVCDADLKWLNQSDSHHIIDLHSDLYPQRLKEIYDSPVMIYVKGHVSCLNDIQISIVGSRQQTPSGRKMASILSGGLAQVGVTITSGLALGVDTTAHEACITHGGNTVAVLGCGIDRIYPLANRKLFSDIIENGCLISEFPLGVPPKSQNFPIRNRLISGLSSGLVVVEAALRSGSLITSRLALEQGREVFAVPGNPLSSQSRGCHYLIKQGAKLVECVDDILEDLVVDFRNSVQLIDKSNSVNAHSKLLTAKEIDDGLLKWVYFDPISQDEIIQLSGLTSAEVSSMLLDMELAGIICRDNNGFYSRL